MEVPYECQTAKMHEDDYVDSFCDSCRGLGLGLMVQELKEKKMSKVQRALQELLAGPANVSYFRFKVVDERLVYIIHNPQS